MLHALKIESCFFEEIRKGNKRFEIRVNDRNFQLKDCLLLKEIDSNKEYTNRKLLVEITYICGYLQNENVVVLSIK